MSAVQLKSPAAPTFGIETVTPKLASAWLKLNRQNRPLARGTVRNYADEIRAGHWMLNGEAIKFDWNGHLVDGQHRLGAIVMAEMPIATLVIRGLDPEAFKTIDTGKVRSSADVLALRGIKYAGELATAYRLLYRYMGLGRSKSRISNTELLALVEARPDMVDVGYECMVKPLDASLIAPANRIFFYYLAKEIDGELAHSFLASVAGRQNTNGCAARLRERLRQVSNEVIPPAPKVKWLWLLMAWNAAVAGEPCPRLSRMPDEVEWDPQPSLVSRPRRRK